MSMLFEVISSLNKEERRFFKLFASRTNSSADRKDLHLFDYFTKQNNPEEDKIFSRLYGKNKNAFYRLKNRLLSDINKSLLLQHIGNETDLSTLQYLLLSRVFKQKRKTQVAVYYLKTAEKKATKTESFELLNIIYNELIKLSHEMISIDVEEYIEKRKSNNIKLQQLHEIDDVLAAVMYRVKSAQNFSGKSAPIIEMLQNTVNDFTENNDIKTSSKLRIKIYQAVSRILLQKHDYTALEEYLRHTIAEFKKDGLYKKETHDIKLQMLTYLINSLFKNKKYTQSLKHTQELEKEMEAFGGFLKNSFLFYLYNSLVINYSVIDKEKAIKILEEAKNNTFIKQLPTYTVFIYLNMALILFDLKRYKPAIKHLSRLYLHEDFTKIAKSFQIKILAAGLIMRYEIGDFDHLELQIRQWKKEFEDLLSKKEFKREVLLVDILSDLVYNDSIKNTPSLLQKSELLISKLSDDEAEDVDVINYNHWIKSKL